MPTHPFAIKLSEALDRAKRARDAMKRTKKAADEVVKDTTEGPLSRQRFVFNPLQGSGDWETLANAENPGGGIQLAVQNERLRNQPLKEKDPGRRPYLAAVMRERKKCEAHRIRANEAYYRCIAKARNDALNGGGGSNCKGLYVQTTCPNLRAAEKALDEYDKNKKTRIGPDAKGGA